MAQVRFSPTPPARKLRSRTVNLGLVVKAESVVARSFCDMLPSKRRKEIFDAVNIGAMISRKEVN